MKKLEQLLEEDRPIIAKLLGVPVSRLKQLDDHFQMLLKGKMKKAELDKWRGYTGQWLLGQRELTKHFADQVEPLMKSTKGLKGYVVEMNYSDQSLRATLILRKICPCCGKY